jgi:hypothetical protein
VLVCRGPGKSLPRGLLVYLRNRESGMAVNTVLDQRFLGGSEYPGRKEALVRHAAQRASTDEVIGASRLLLAREHDNRNAVRDIIGARTRVGQC